MPIALHLALAFIARLVGFLAACLLASYAMWLAGSLLAPNWRQASKAVTVPLAFLSMAVMFASVYGGIRAGNRLVMFLPARCPQCGRHAWGSGCKIVTYSCEACPFMQERRTERG